MFYAGVVAVLIAKMSHFSLQHFPLYDTYKKNRCFKNLIPFFIKIFSLLLHFELVSYFEAKEHFEFIILQLFLAFNVSMML